MKRLQRSARYLCYRINEIYGEIIKPSEIEGTHAHCMSADRLIPPQFYGRALDVAFDEFHGPDVFMTKGLSEGFIEKNIGLASKGTQAKFERYKHLLKTKYGDKKAYEKATDQNEIARQNVPIDN